MGGWARPELLSKRFEFFPLIGRYDDEQHKLFWLENCPLQPFPVAGMKTVLVKVWLGVRVSGKINPFAVTNNKFVLSPVKLGEVCFDAWYHSLKHYCHKLACSAQCINIFQPLTDVLLKLINTAHVL